MPVLHTEPSLRRARLCRGLCARELHSLRLAGMKLQTMRLRARLHYTRLGCLGIWNAGEHCRGGEHRGNEGGGEGSFKHGLHDTASHYSYQADVSADLCPPRTRPPTAFRPKLAETAVEADTFPHGRKCRYYLIRYSDPNRQKHPRIHHFPSEYRHAQLHATVFRPKQAKPTPKTGSSPHGHRWARWR